MNYSIERHNVRVWVGLTKAFSLSLGNGISSSRSCDDSMGSIAFSQNYSVERDVRMNVGDSVKVANYEFTFQRDSRS